MTRQKCVCRASIPLSLFLGASEALALGCPLQLWTCFRFFRLFAVPEGLCNLAKIYIKQGKVVVLDSRVGVKGPGREIKGQISVPCKCVHKVYIAHKLVWPLPLCKGMSRNRDSLCQGCQQRRVHKQDQHDGKIL